MEQLFNLFLNHKITITLLSTLALLAFKYLLVKWVRSRAIAKGEDRRDLVNNIKNFINFLLIVVLLGLWTGELQEFALSIAAFSVAIVLAAREFIQCVIGFFYLVSNRPFRIGDWIQIDQVIGEVGATDLLKTTLLEIDIHKYQYTGKSLFIPNNKLITSPIKNLNFLKRYATHHFSIVRDQSTNPYEFIETLQVKAREYCDDFNDVAVRYNNMIERRLDVKIAGPEPHISVKTTDLGDTKVEFTIFCPTERVLEIEQKITREFMRLWFSAQSNKNTISE